MRKRFIILLLVGIGVLIGLYVITHIHIGLEAACRARLRFLVGTDTEWTARGPYNLDTMYRYKGHVIDADPAEWWHPNQIMWLSNDCNRVVCSTRNYYSFVFRDESERGCHPRLIPLDRPLPANPAADGSIAYALTQHRGLWTVLLAYEDGSEATNLTHAVRVLDWDPAFSPDGTQLAFTTKVAGAESGALVIPGSGDTPWHIGVIQSDGTGRRTITPEENWHSSRPAWSPDGQRLVFQSTRHKQDTWNIWVVDSDGNNIEQLTDDPAAAMAPVWSPDGNSIAFHSYRDGNLYVMQTDGTHQGRLTDHLANDTDPDWSPDGTQIAFQSSRDTPDGCGMNVWVMDADGSNLRNLTGHTDCTRSGAPAWSPDGQQIVFQGYRRGNERSLYVIDADGTDEQLVIASRERGPVGFPDWQPE
jgi:tol-pal system beta propeller repeat protein TolB